jgi:hypothetical protein
MTAFKILLILGLLLFILSSSYVVVKLIPLLIALGIFLAAWWILSK